MTTEAVPRWTTHTPFAVPSTPQHIQAHELDGEAVLFDSNGGTVYHLNETAMAVWRQCDGDATTWDIARWQSENYDVDFETALDHVEQVVIFFCESGLLEARSDG